MKNVLWDIKPQFVLHRIHVMSLLQSTASLWNVSFDVLKAVTMKNVVRFEDFTAVTMKNGVFWDIKTQFVLHRRHITSPLQSPAS
jgi:hypothetical protein